MQEETRIALMNYDWLVRNRGDVVQLLWDQDTIIDSESGGADINLLIEPGYTPATREDRD